MALTFGETDSTTEGRNFNIITFSYYGTNGAFLKFEDSSSLGTDSNGSNNFTVSGNVRQSVSTPSNNFCTLDVSISSTKCRLSGTHKNIH